MADQQTILVGGGVGTAFSVISFIIYRFLRPAFTAANHHRVRTVCCGQTCVTSLDVEETTPVPTTVQVPNIKTPALPAPSADPVKTSSDKSADR